MKLNLSLYNKIEERILPIDLFSYDIFEEIIINRYEIRILLRCTGQSSDLPALYINAVRELMGVSNFLIIGGCADFNSLVEEFDSPTTILHVLPAPRGYDSEETSKKGFLTLQKYGWNEILKVAKDLGMEYELIEILGKKLDRK